MSKIDRIDCDKVAYGYFNPNCTPSQLSYDDAALRFAVALRTENVKSRGEVRERMKRVLPTDLYVATLEKLADGEDRY